MSTTWLTAAELAGLPGMPGSEFRTRAKLEKLGIASRIRQGRSGGGGREWDCSQLPAETRAALLLRAIEEQPAQGLPAVVPETPVVAADAAGLPAAAAPTLRPASRQAQACADARMVVLRHLRNAAHLCGGITRAAAELSAQLKAGVASAELLDHARTAHQRQRKADEAGVSIGVRTLFAWHTAEQAGGWSALLPEDAKPQAVQTIDPDVALVLRRYASTDGAARNLTLVARAVNTELGRPYDEWRTLYDRARRALPKLDRVKLIKARHTHAERAAKLPFKRRDAGMLRPLDVVVCDGHTFKAKVRHPDHGQPFAPEVTAYMDVATRKVIGWSVALSESTIAVGDALRHTVATHGVPALVYTDNGSGEKAKYFDCPITGLFERLGIEHRTGRPRHPQGHGIIERSWRTHMINAARQYATYQGGDADDGKVRDMALELAREQRAVKRAQADGEVIRLTNKCPSWRQFFTDIEAAFGEYNARHRHRGLPKHESGPYAGKHPTPDEAWAAMVVPSDVQRLDEPTLRALFMPAKVATAQRGEVRFMNQHYFSHDLMQVDGEKVRVHYDIHDPAAVWVWTLEGQFVCEAKWAANRIDYFPKPVIEMAREKRVQAAIKRREAQIDTARRELTPTLPAPEAPLTFIGDISAPARERATLEVLQRVDAPAAATAAPAAPGAEGADRPFFDSPADRFEWLMQHPEGWLPAERAWIETYAASDDYARLADYFRSRGIAWEQEGDDEAFNQAG